MPRLQVACNNLLVPKLHQWNGPITSHWYLHCRWRRMRLISVGKGQDLAILRPREMQLTNLELVP